MSDAEDDEVWIDYSQLLGKKSKKNQALKRGEKTNVPHQLDQQQLARSRQALFECIAQKVPTPKNASVGQLSASPPYHTTITKSKGTHLHSMGFSHQGAITLFPEEAAFLIARNALTVTQHDADPTHFEDYCQLMCECCDGWITFDKYQVYAYLKRLGYIVMRSKKLPVTTKQTAAKEPSMPSMFKLLFDTITHWIQPLQSRPLVWDYRCTNYPQMYSTLQIIPSTPWYKPFYTSLCPAFDWDVYKPRPGWKKKDPGEPDFRVVVKNVHEAMPTLYEQNQFFSQLIGTCNINYKPALKHTALGLLAPTFVMALVGDAEGITFLRLTGDGVEDVSNVEAFSQKRAAGKTAGRSIV
ncbi:transcriptional regulator of sulfur amino acid metabolism [Mucor velutinosus]|uniref:Transcriptional regulator of sulfur amino acid metabolism n=1 Tax=Mucor velutinosus TaxID=708070 RepID=A0AAN7DDI9_9FUNG|nr:transcriptional regulator of sulfur amino acid metabolism [Mucor velutinosus]